jgi:hypothetical protein
LLCSRCNTTRYCSKECQISHWKDHKKGIIGDQLLSRRILKSAWVTSRESTYQ